MKKWISVVCLTTLFILMIGCHTSVADPVSPTSPVSPTLPASPTAEPTLTPDEILWQDAWIILEGEDILALNQYPYTGGALLGDGRVLAWGDFSGAGITEENLYASNEYDDLYDMGMKNITQFWLSKFSGYFIDADGNLWGTGYDTMGTFGAGDWLGSADDPVLVLENVVSAIGGTRFGGAVQTDGSVWVFGSYYSHYQEDTGGDVLIPPTKVTEGAMDILYAGELVCIHDKDGNLFSLGTQEELLKTGTANPVPMSVGARWEDSVYRWDWSGELFQKGEEAPILEDVSYLNVQTSGSCVAVTANGELYVWKHVYDMELAELWPVNSTVPALLTEHIRLAAPYGNGVTAVTEDGRLVWFPIHGINETIRAKGLSTE